MRWLALGEALTVIALWSASPALVKMALRDMAPTQIAGVRYFLGFLTLLPWIIFRRGNLPSHGTWLRLALMGILAYPIGNSLLFWALETLPSTTSAFLLNAIPIATLTFGAFWLGEVPTRGQWLGIGVAFLGAALFFGNGVRLTDGRAVAASLLGALALAVFGVVARQIARQRTLDVVQLSAWPMGIGGGLLLLLQPAAWKGAEMPWGLLVFLGVVNSALAYVLWNHALHTLAAFEISLVGNLLPMGTAMWAPWFLQESVSARAWLGILVSFVGVLLVAAAKSGNRRIDRRAELQTDRAQ